MKRKYMIYAIMLSGLLVMPTHAKASEQLTVTQENVKVIPNNRFLENISQSAQKLGQENDLYASIMMAQAFLESAGGTSALAVSPHYNLFGIKGSYMGQSAEFSTREEYPDGSEYYIKTGFREYPSYHESLQDYVTLIKGGIDGDSFYYSRVWKSNTQNYLEGTQALMGKYATDTAYAEKLNDIIDRYNLTVYDKVSDETLVKADREVSEVEKNSSSQVYEITISSGDTLSEIGAKYQVSVEELARLNNIIDINIIYAGNTLIIKT